MCSRCSVSLRLLTSAFKTFSLSYSSSASDSSYKDDAEASDEVAADAEALDEVEADVEALDEVESVAEASEDEYSSSI